MMSTFRIIDNFNGSTSIVAKNSGEVLYTFTERILPKVYENLEFSSEKMEVKLEITASPKKPTLQSFDKKKQKSQIIIEKSRASARGRRFSSETNRDVQVVAEMTEPIPSYPTDYSYECIRNDEFFQSLGLISKNELGAAKMEDLKQRFPMRDYCRVFPGREVYPDIHEVDENKANKSWFYDLDLCNSFSHKCMAAQGAIKHDLAESTVPKYNKYCGTQNYTPYILGRKYPVTFKPCHLKKHDYRGYFGYKALKQQAIQKPVKKPKTRRKVKSGNDEEKQQQKSGKTDAYWLSKFKIDPRRQLTLILKHLSPIECSLYNGINQDRNGISKSSLDRSNRPNIGSSSSQRSDCNANVVNMDESPTESQSRVVDLICKENFDECFRSIMDKNDSLHAEPLVPSVVHNEEQHHRTGACDRTTTEDSDDDCVILTPLPIKSTVLLRKSDTTFQKERKSGPIAFSLTGGYNVKSLSLAVQPKATVAVSSKIQHFSKNFVTVDSVLKENSLRNLILKNKKQKPASGQLVQSDPTELSNGLPVPGCLTITPIPKKIAQKEQCDASDGPNDNSILQPPPDELDSPMAALLDAQAAVTHNTGHNEVPALSTSLRQIKPKPTVPSPPVVNFSLAVPQTHIKSQSMVVTKLGWRFQLCSKTKNANPTNNFNLNSFVSETQSPKNNSDVLQTSREPVLLQKNSRTDVSMQSSPSIPDDQEDCTVVFCSNDSVLDNDEPRVQDLADFLMDCAEEIVELAPLEEDKGNSAETLNSAKALSAKKSESSSHWINMKDEYCKKRCFVSLTNVEEELLMCADGCYVKGTSIKVRQDKAHTLRKENALPINDHDYSFHKDVRQNTGKPRCEFNFPITADFCPQEKPVTLCNNIGAKAIQKLKVVPTKSVQKDLPIPVEISMPIRKQTARISPRKEKSLPMHKKKSPFMPKQKTFQTQREKSVIKERVRPRKCLSVQSNAGPPAVNSVAPVIDLTNENDERNDKWKQIIFHCWGCNQRRTFKNKFEAEQITYFHLYRFHCVKKPLDFYTRLTDKENRILRFEAFPALPERLRFSRTVI